MEPTHAVRLQRSLRERVMMLDPSKRIIYGELLTPPAGYQFDSGIAVTYSMSLASLMQIPVRFAKFGVDDEEELLRDKIALFEALQQTTDKLTVFCQHGRLAAASKESPLATLLEPMVREVSLRKVAPQANLHAKMWLMRYRAIESSDTLLRLVVPSRNVTSDPCWDVALALNAIPKGGPKAKNKPLFGLLQWLLKQDGSLPKERRANLSGLAEDIHRAQWECPEGVDTIEFAVTGIGAKVKGWPLERGGKRIAIISPFLRVGALDMIAGTAPNAPVALVSRAEELQTLPKRFSVKRWQMSILHRSLLDEAAAEDDPSIRSVPPGDLHAKIYLADYALGAGGRLAIVVGSANATRAALVDQSNIEIMVRLTGRRKNLGTVEKLFSNDALGRYLHPYTWTEQHTKRISSMERALELGRRHILENHWRLYFEREQAGMWKPIVSARQEISWPVGVSCHCWLVTGNEETAVKLAHVKPESRIGLQPCALADVISFLAFSLQARGLDPVRFSVNVRDFSPPSERDAAVTRSVIGDRTRFLTYLRFLLGELDGPDRLRRPPRRGDPGNGGAGSAAPALLEDLVRSLSRDQARLRAIRRLMNEVHTDAEGLDVVPEKFRHLWSVVEPLLA